MCDHCDLELAKQKKEIHCLRMLNKYRKAISNSLSDDETELLHNLRASVFLELKQLRTPPPLITFS